jgi:hypothetical protein
LLVIKFWVMELIDKGDYIYFESLVSGYDSYIEEYEFTYRYVRYKCRSNYSAIFQYKYDIYRKIINHLDFILRGDDCDNNIIYHCIGNSFDRVKGYVSEIICINSLHKYYVMHKLDELDIDNIIKNNRFKYNISDENIEMILYSRLYNRERDVKGIDRSIKFEVINDDSRISDIFR